MPHHHISASRHSQEKKLRQIALMRRSKRWLKQVLVVIAVVLAVAVALSYIFITKDKAPDQLEVPEKGFHGIF